jgi:signal transduction histidine kinase
MISLNRITSIVVGFLAMVFFFLIWQGYDNYRRVQEYHQGLANRTVSATSSEISILIRSYRRMLKLFSAEHAEELIALMQNPQNHELADSLGESLRMFLPEYEDYVLADSGGNLLFTQISEDLGDACRMALTTFARSGLEEQPVKIHTDEHGSHFDIVVGASHDGQKGMFFVSFMVERLEDILRHGQASGHHMLLLNTYQKQHLALALQETRNRYSQARILAGFDGEIVHVLKDGVSQQILSEQAVAGTQWIVADLPDSDLYAMAWHGIVMEYGLIFITFVGITIIMLLLTRREGVRSGETALTIEGIEVERRRIAMDLHDQVLGEVTHIGRGLDECQKSCTDDSDTKTKFVQLRESLDIMGDSIRTVIDDLHPQALSILGLEDAFRAMLEKRTANLERPGWSLSVEEGIDAHMSKVDRLSLYRILMEVTHNVIKHARAEQFEISIRCIEQKKMEVIIQDDGIGFNPKNSGSTNSLGMANILTRARMMNASVAWTTPPSGKGTRFELVKEV